jgi:L-ascorbate metabolism protein UlaG (beta-lactamase superfamily)
MQIIWLGHAAFRIETGSSVILIDPFLKGNPKFTGSFEDATRGVTHVVLTHGHDDHIGDTVEICKATGATLVATFEVCMWLNSQGVEKFSPGNPGGPINFDDFSVTFTSAFHSSSTLVDGRPVYLGIPCGVIVKAEGHAVYHTGDTEVFGNMAFVEELHHPDVGLLPVGGRFTMDAAQAAFACKKFFKFKTIVPMHFGTSQIIAQDPSEFVTLMEGHNVVTPEIGKVITI